MASGLGRGNGHHAGNQHGYYPPPLGAYPGYPPQGGHRYPPSGYPQAGYPPQGGYPGPYGYAPPHGGLGPHMGGGGMGMSWMLAGGGYVWNSPAITRTRRSRHGGYRHHGKFKHGKFKH
ncbi:hypothetical protein MKW94_001631 [Papaver nudicaule]|uniref:Uncharacterized protein n=1 Tax=Papaver nudicaule TaxID=74823 RepID=A0AA42B0L0_PAPNU|nr:hypothetical protein [Papaver nudicaule]